MWPDQTPRAAPHTIGDPTQAFLTAPDGNDWAFTDSLTFIGGFTEEEEVTTQKPIVRPRDDYHVGESPETVVM